MVELQSMFSSKFYFDSFFVKNLTKKKKTPNDDGIFT